MQNAQTVFLSLLQALMIVLTMLTFSATYVWLNFLLHQILRILTLHIYIGIYKRLIYGWYTIICNEKTNSYIQHRIMYVVILSHNGARPWIIDLKLPWIHKANLTNKGTNVIYITSVYNVNTVYRLHASAYTVASN